MTSKDIVLREFKYFDRQVVIDFLSSIEGGLATTSRSSVTKKSGKLGSTVRIPLILEARGEKGSNETSIEESKTIGDAALFQRLYIALTGQNMIEKVDAIKEDSLQIMSQGKILEIHGAIELPFIEKVLDFFNQFIPMIPQLPIPQRIDPKALDAFNVINGIISSSALNIRIVPIQESKVNLVAPLNRQKLKVTKQELSDECFTLCRVRKILKENETFDMFKFPVKMNEKVREDFLKMLGNMPPQILEMLGKKPAVEDFQVHYPAVILSPIAIYQ